MRSTACPDLSDAGRGLAIRCCVPIGGFRLLAGCNLRWLGSVLPLCTNLRVLDLHGNGLQDGCLDPLVGCEFEAGVEVEVELRLAFDEGLRCVSASLRSPF